MSNVSASKSDNMLADYEFQMAVITVWRQARGEPFAVKVAVAETIRTRLESEAWPDNLLGVILEPYQFSCFLASDPNVTKFPPMKNGEPAGRAHRECIAAVSTVFDERWPGQHSPTHYHALPEGHAEWPKWAHADREIF
jgi:spore germination cell wall hydrolase CwlJ-like protein